MSRRSLIAVLVALGLLATSCGSSAATEAVASAPDEVTVAEPAAQAVPAPAHASLVVDTVSGGQIDFASLQGQDVVLWFWAPW